MKRDTNSPVPPVNGGASLPSTPTASTTKTESPTPQSTQQHLLGVDGAGQRKYYPNDTKTAGSDPASAVAPAADNKTPTVNKSLGAVQQPSTSPTPPMTKQNETEATDTDDIEKLVSSIDEPEEAINKTITDELTNSTKRVDYFQYYNSTTLVDKNKSDEYWSATKDYTISSILSKSHRRAIVSIAQQPIVFDTVLLCFCVYVSAA